VYRERFKEKTAGPAEPGENTARENRWKLVIGAEGFSEGQFTSQFFRFIIPSLSAGGEIPGCRRF